MSTTVDRTNDQQAKAWNGDDGDHWTEYEEHYNAAVRRYDSHLLDAARISPRDEVLDIGCGCGVSSRGTARIAVSGGVLGVDLSRRMIDRAREHSREDGLTNTRFEHADAQVYRFDGEAFDIAISRFGAMFFGDAVAAFRNVGHALRPGGHLVLLTWQELAKNEWLLAVRGALAAGRALPDPPMGAPGPFGLADAATTRRVLEAAGFHAIDMREIREPIELGSDADDAFAFVRGLGITKGLIDGLEDDAATRALDELRAMLRAHDTGRGVRLDSCAWLVTAHHGRSPLS